MAKKSKATAKLVAAVLAKHRKQPSKQELHQQRQEALLKRKMRLAKKRVAATTSQVQELMNEWKF